MIASPNSSSSLHGGSALNGQAYFDHASASGAQDDSFLVTVRSGQDSVQSNKYAGNGNATAGSPRKLSMRRSPSSSHYAASKKRSYKKLIWSVIALSTLVLTIIDRRRKPPPPRRSRRAAECDPFSEPGHLVLNLTSPILTEWKSYAQSRCRPIPDVLPAFWRLARVPNTPLPTRKLPSTMGWFETDMADPGQRHVAPEDPKSSPLLPLLRKKRRKPPTALLIGDSIDRNGLIHFCQLFEQPVQISMYDDKNAHPPPFPTDDLTTNHGPAFEGWDQRGLPHLCEVPFASGGRSLAIRIMNMFHYGMDELDEFNVPSRNDWHRPGKFEDRMEQLFLPYLQQFGGPDAVDLVIFQSGIWDLALFGTQDERAGQSLAQPLRNDHMAWWTERMTIVVRLIKTTFPNSRIVIRQMHRTADSSPSKAYLTDYFGHPLEGYQMFQNRVHPDLATGGAVYASGLLYHMEQALQNRPSGWL